MIAPTVTICSVENCTLHCDGTRLIELDYSICLVTDKKNSIFLDVGKNRWWADTQDFANL